MGYLYKRGRIWWVKYYRNGHPKRESTGTDKETEAKRFLKEREGAVANGRPILPRADKVGFEELAQDFLNDYRVNGKRSIENAERNVRHLAEAFTGRRVVSITTTDIRAYIERRQQAGASNATINRELAALKRMFNLAIQAEKVYRKPHIPSLEENNVRTGFFSEVDFLALHDALPAHLRPIATFAYTYGWRKSEIASLTWDQVDFAARTVRLNPGATKNKEGRTVVLTEELHTLLLGQWAKAREIVQRRKPDATPRDVAEAIPWVFHHDGKPIKSFRRSWRTACISAGLPGRILHDFRRTAVRNMVRAGIPERVAMTITGHRTRSVFDRYNIVSEGDLQEAAKKLAGTDSGTMAQKEAVSRGGYEG